MGQAGWSIDIADSVNPRHVRAAVFIDWNKATLTAHPGSLQAKVLDVPLHTNGHQYFCPLHGMGPRGGLHLHLDTIRHDLGTLHTTAYMNRNTLLFERFM